MKDFQGRGPSAAHTQRSQTPTSYVQMPTAPSLPGSGLHEAWCGQTLPALWGMHVSAQWLTLLLLPPSSSSVHSGTAVTPAGMSPVGHCWARVQ